MATKVPAHIPHGPILKVKRWGNADEPVALLPQEHARVGFTGTRHLWDGTLSGIEVDRAAQRMREWVGARNTYIPDTTAITWVQGGCTGIDTLAGITVFRTARADGHIHTVLPADLVHVDASWREWTDTYEQLPKGTTHLQRDWAIVDVLAGYNHHTGQRVRSPFPSLLYAMALYPEASDVRSGTWATVRHARLMGKQVWPITIVQHVIRPEGPPGRRRGA
jgi:hypothetical protein